MLNGNTVNARRVAQGERAVAHPPAAIYPDFRAVVFFETPLSAVFLRWYPCSCGCLLTRLLSDLPLLLGSSGILVFLLVE
jgi:hypothetical protein